MKMTKTVIASAAIGIISIACQKGTPPSAPAATQGSAAVGTTTSVSKPTPAGSAQGTTVLGTPYKQMVKVFDEFAKIVEENQQNPDAGVEKCKSFANSRIPEIKNLTVQIKSIETGTLASNYLQEIMDSNNKIKESTDKVTALAQEKYHEKGADVMLILADLALARL